MYIDYAYYKENGGLSDIVEAAFSPLEFRARKEVDRLTQKRIAGMEKTPEAVKRLMVELVNLESIGGSQAALNPALASFSNDGYSESYAEPLTAEIRASMGEKLILTYLSSETDDGGTPLLWLGVE